jgi:hypothetical protein
MALWRGPSGAGGPRTPKSELHAKKSGRARGWILRVAQAPQQPTGPNRACTRCMKGCNIIDGFFFYFYLFIRGGIFFYYIGIIISEGGIFLLCWNNYFSLKKLFRI